MFSFDVSWVGVILATVASVIIGATWYSPAIFGSFWARSLGYDESSLTPSPLNYGGAVLVAFVMSLILAVFIKQLPVTGIIDGAKVGFMAWLGFVAPVLFSGVIWAGKPILVYLIDVGCNLVILVAAGAILGFLR